MRFLLVVLGVLLVLEGVEPLEDRGLLGLPVVCLALGVDFGVEGTGVLLGLQVVLEGVPLLCYFPRELLLLPQKFLQRPLLALVRGFGFKGALRVYFALLLLLEFAQFALLVSQPAADLFADELLPALEGLYPAFLVGLLLF